MQKQIRKLFLFFFLLIFAHQAAFANNGFQKQGDDLKKLYPHAIISEESYGILNKQDLEINSCNTSPEPFSEHAISYPYWQCLPTKSASFICDNKNKDGTYSKHDSLLFININDSKNKAVYVARRAMEHTDCLLLKKQWNTLTLNEKYVCLLGINAGLDKEPDGTMSRTWVFESFKTKKGCESYFVGYCDLKYLKKHKMCKE